MTTIAACRACNSARLDPVLSLGNMPLANSLLDSAGDNEPRYPLEVVRCEQCTLVQITETVPPEVLFREYGYFSSFSDTFVAHAGAFARRMHEEVDLGADSLVVEAASNDGYLLQFFAELGIPVLGIEPALNIAASANARGIETVAEFLDLELARSVVERRGRHADLVVANNGLAHVADLRGFVDALRTLAGDEGLVSVEVPYVRELVDRLEFDTIYHEHLCYFSLTSLARLFAERGMTVIDVEQLPIHGGSLRVLARADGARAAERVAALLAEEEAWGVAAADRYAAFARETDALRGAIATFAKGLVSDGAQIVGYGAAAKAVVLSNACGLDASLVEYVVDRNPYKQGKLLPGVRIPVRPPEALLDMRPDYVLLFVWNIASEVIDQQRAFVEAGGRFIVPVPEPLVTPRAR